MTLHNHPLITTAVKNSDKKKSKKASVLKLSYPSCSHPLLPRRRHLNEKTPHNMRNNPSGDGEVPSFRNSLERCWALEEPRPDRNLRGLKGTEKSTQIDEQTYQKDPTVSAGLRTDEEGGHSRFKDAGLDNGLKVFFQSACACLQF